MGANYSYNAPTAATRYQPGHVSYVGYAAVYEGLGFIREVGLPEIRRRSTHLVTRLLDSVDQDFYRVLTPAPEGTPILSLEPRAVEGLRDRLTAAGVTVGVGGDMARLIRISPSVYNNEDDVDRLAQVLHEHARA